MKTEALKRLANWLSLYRVGVCVSLALVALRPGLCELGALAVCVAAKLIETLYSDRTYHLDSRVTAMQHKIVRIANQIGLKAE